MTDPTELHLLRGIIAHPHDDTPRLVFADWLDEHAGTVPCPACLRVESSGLAATDFLSHATGECYKCDSPNGTTGTVSDGRHERAEFIRLGCELARLHDAGHGAGASKECPVSVAYRADKRPGGQMFPKCRRCEDAFDAEHRERELLTAHRREWSRVPCPKCATVRARIGGFAGLCATCDSTGDAMQREGCTPHYRRGFVSRVEVPGLAWLFERCINCEAKSLPCPLCHGQQWRVTPWALAVAAAHPVTEFVIGDKEPDIEPGGTANNGRCGWHMNDDHEDDFADLNPYLPPVLFRALRASVYGEIAAERLGLAIYATREQALVALATAAADVVREAVLEMWAKEVRT